MIVLTYSTLSTTNLSTLGRRTIQYSERTADATIQANPLLTELKTRSAAYDEVVLRRIYSGMGLTIAGADLYRDRMHRNLKRILKGYAGFSDMPKGEAAAALLEAFEETGSVTNLNYADESAVVNKLLALLATPANQAHITTLDLVEEVKALRLAQENFSRLFLEQVGANAELRKLPSASSLRHELEDALRDYYSYVTAMRKMAPWSDLFHALVELAKAARNGTHDFAPENETPGTETPPAPPSPAGPVAP